MNILKIFHGQYNIHWNSTDLIIERYGVSLHISIFHFELLAESQLYWKAKTMFFVQIFAFYRMLFSSDCSIISQRLFWFFFFTQFLQDAIVICPSFTPCSYYSSFLGILARLIKIKTLYCNVSGNHFVGWTKRWRRKRFISTTATSIYALHVRRFWNGNRIRCGVFIIFTARSRDPGDGRKGLSEVRQIDPFRGLVEKRITYHYLPSVHPHASVHSSCAHIRVGFSSVTPKDWNVWTWDCSRTMLRFPSTSADASDIEFSDKIFFFNLTPLLNPNRPSILFDY